MLYGRHWFNIVVWCDCTIVIEIAGYSTVKGQVLDGDQLWTLIEGLEANDLLHYTHLLTGKLFFVFDDA